MVQAAWCAADVPWYFEVLDAKRADQMIDAYHMQNINCSSQWSVRYICIHKVMTITTILEQFLCTLKAKPESPTLRPMRRPLQPAGNDSACIL